MTALTLTKTPLPAPAPAAEADFDRTDGDQIADEILLESAAKTRPGRVGGDTRRSATRSADSRAWTSSGRVD